MRHKTSTLISCLIFVAAYQPAAAADDLCEPLRLFAASVAPGESRTLTYQTIWGGNFKDRQETGTAAKRCDYASYEPAKPVCVYLMKYGGYQFTAQNAKLALQCLSKKTRFDPYVEVHSISATAKYGTEARGSHVKIEFQQNTDVGGVALTITAVGY